jgi:two-component system nitrate/nitrite response regulator NarL
MNLNTVQEKQRLPIQQIPTILICRNSLVRAGICHILEGTRFLVAGEVDGSSALPVFLDASPALYILDDSHPAEALARMVANLKAQHPSAQVAVLADHLDMITMMQALQAGMNGLCSTKMPREALIKVLELVMLRETFIPSALALTMLIDMSQVDERRPDICSAHNPADDTATRTHNLSGREVEILEHLMEGESNKEIARKLNIAEATIKVHVKTILRKVRVTNRTQAALWATAHLSAAPGGSHLAQGGTSWA